MFCSMCRIYCNMHLNLMAFYYFSVWPISCPKTEHTLFSKFCFAFSLKLAYLLHMLSFREQAQNICENENFYKRQVCFVLTLSCFQSNRQNLYKVVA